MQFRTPRQVLHWLQHKNEMVCKHSDAGGPEGEIIQPRVTGDRVNRQKFVAIIVRVVIGNTSSTWLSRRKRHGFRANWRRFI